MIHATRATTLKELTHTVNACLEFCQSQGYSIAIWREPTLGTAHLIIDFSDRLEEVTAPIEELTSGFILAPFDKNLKKYFVKAEYSLDLIEFKLDHKQDLEISKKVEQLNQFIENYRSKQFEPLELIINDDLTQDEYNFKALIETSIQCIKDGKFQKVVPSRRKSLSVNHNIDIGNYYKTLCETYPNAFVSVTYSKETGLWLGATPELLIGINESNIFKTVALAGTQKREPEVNINDVAWTQKEIEEQAFVSRYIINCFKKIRLREFEEIGPKTVIAGNLLHLKTIYTVNMAETNFPQLGSVMLDLLHPTSAICGMPLEPTQSFLAQKEGYNRSLFSGYIGPVNFRGSTNIYVNLRCMQILENSVVLYAGAGVTEDSTPEKEWLETEMKMNTLLNVIG